MSKKHPKPKPKHGTQPNPPKRQPSTTPHPSAAVVEKRATPSTSREVRLDPLAPLVIRSGRPFDDQSGVDAARLPPPSTTAGALRTAYAQQQGLALNSELLSYAVEGPLLLRGETILIPKPADALYVGQGDEAELVRALPQPYAEGCGSDLPDGLLPIQLEECEVKGKSGHGPAWWALSDWQAFQQGKPLSHQQISRNGWSLPAGERRTHVAIDHQRLAAESGKLFQTEGLDLGRTLNDKGEVGAAVQLLLRFAEPLQTGVVLPLGGERRLAAVQVGERSAWPEPPQGWLESIRKAGGLSLTLVTAGLLADGYRPGWLNAEGVGSPPEAEAVQLRLRAVACGRWQPHSGWDLVGQQPKPTRKLVAAGAVYWFEIQNAAQLSTEQLRRLWLTSLCDEPQDRRDGFGLALPAAWQPL